MIFPLMVSPTQHTALRAGSPMLVPLGASSLATSIRASSAVLSRQGTGPALLSAAAGEGQRYLSCFHDPRTRSPTYQRW